MPSTWIKNGNVVTAKRSFAADILIDGEKIGDIAPGLPAGNVTWDLTFFDAEVELST